MSLLSLALKNISRNPFRSWLIFACALLIAGLALSTILIVQGASTSLRRAADRMGADIIVVPKGTESKVESALLMGTPTTAWMPAQNLAKVATVSGVQAASPQLFLASLSGASCCSASNMFVVAYDPATDFTVSPWLRSSGGGTGLGQGEVVGGSLVVAPPGEGIKLYGSTLAVKTNLEPTGTSLDQSVFLTFATAKEVARLSVTQAEQPLVVPPDSISAVMVKLAPGAVRAQVAASIMQQVPQVTAIEGTDLFGSFRTQMNGLVRGMLAVLALTLVLSLVVISLIFSMAVHERRREIGVLRALGATRSAVLVSLLGEALVLATGGALVGIALAAFGISLFRQLIMSSVGFPFLFPSAPTLVALVVGGLLLALLGVALAAFVPAFRISRQDPALAMRE
jgi:putative ABC transport system permease protein